MSRAILTHFAIMLPFLVWLIRNFMVNTSRMVMIIQIGYIMLGCFSVLILMDTESKTGIDTIALVFITPFAMAVFWILNFFIIIIFNISKNTPNRISSEISQTFITLLAAVALFIILFGKMGKIGG